MSIFYGYEEITEATEPTGVVFDLNVDKCVKAGGVVLNGARVKAIFSGKSTLVQNKRSLQPEIGAGGGILSVRAGVKCAMHFFSPRIQYMNIHYFFICVKLGRVNSTYFDSLINNDNGYWSRLVGYKAGSDTRLTFGGGFPKSELTSTFVGNVSRKHLISIHWQNGTVHCRFNGKPTSGGLKTANIASNGSSHGTIFANSRDGSKYSNHSNLEFFGMRIMEGVMDDVQLENVCGDLVREYKIT